MKIDLIGEYQCNDFRWRVVAEGGNGSKNGV
jgi:hypothetical protein